MSENQTASTPAEPVSTPADEAPESGRQVAQHVVRAQPSDPQPPTGESNTDPAMAALLELFDGPLREVVFPDVSRDALRALASDTDEALAERGVRAAALGEAEEVLALAEAAVAAARTALRDAEATVDERQRALLARGQRALSYAKVFAEATPDLHAQLSAISLARIAQRGRPPTRVETRRAEPEARRTTPEAPEAPRKRGRPRRVIESVALEPVAASVSS